jgi:hypothetical protein
MGHMLIGKLKTTALCKSEQRMSTTGSWSCWRLELASQRTQTVYCRSNTGSSLLEVILF